MKSRTYYIDSAKRIAGTNESFSINVNLPQDIDQYDRVSCVSALVPKSWYTVPAGQNTFTLQEGKTQATVTIPVGSWSRLTFQNKLQTLLNAASPNGWTYALSWPLTTDSQTGIFTFTVSNNTSQPSLIMTAQSPYEVMGFNALSTNTFSSNTLTSTNVVKFQGEDSLFIHASIISDEPTDILTPIYVSGLSDFSNVQYINPDPIALSKAYLKSKNPTWTFSLSDENGNLINLNGLNWLMTIILYQTRLPAMIETQSQEIKALEKGSVALGNPSFDSATIPQIAPPQIHMPSSLVAELKDYFIVDPQAQFPQDPSTEYLQTLEDEPNEEKLLKFEDSKLYHQVQDSAAPPIADSDIKNSELQPSQTQEPVESTKS